MLLQKKMTVSIRLPQEPTKQECFAGEELKKYLEKIFGEVSFTDGKNAEVVFLLGAPSRNEDAKALISQEEFAQAVPGPEGYFYQITGNTALLAGSDGTGTLYAVYEFLERELGCCFGAIPLPQLPAGEVVPQVNQKELADTRKLQAAADLPYRMACVQYGEAGNPDMQLTVPFIDYLAKNRYNRIQTWVSVYRDMVKLGLIEEIEKRGIRLTVGMHQVLGFFLPFEGNEEFPTAYGKEHPEFFRVQVDGRRQTSEGRRHWGQWYLCSRSQGCIEEMAKNMNAWMDRNPVVDTIHLCPNDGVSRQCQCGFCSKYTKTENYLYFASELAKLLKAANEERKIVYIVYLDLWDCPKGISLSDNAGAQISTWTKKGLRHVGKPDGSALLDSHICKNLHDFRNTGSTVEVYEYYMGNYDNLQAVMPAADEMQSIARYFKTHGFSGSGTQIECFNVWNNILNFFTFSRTQYDNNRSLEQNIGELCRLFGKGGEPIAKILRLYEDTMDGQVPINHTAKFFASQVDASAVYDLFEQALALEDTPICRNNIRLMRMAFHYTMILHKDTDEARYELGVMAQHFDTYHVNDPGYGIAFDVPYRTETLPDDKWYQFEI